MKTNAGGKKVLAAVGICAVVVVAVAGALIVGMRLGKGTEKQEVTEKRNVVVTESNVQEVIEELSQQAEQEPVPPGYYTVTMNNEWHFAAGKEISEDAYVANDARNTNDVYFDVVLANNEDEVIYKSPIIPLGAELRDIALDAPLDAGTYDCIAIYHLVDEEQNTVDTLRVRLVIIAE